MMITTNNNMPRYRRFYAPFLAIAMLFLSGPAQAYYSYIVGNLNSQTTVSKNHGPTSDVTYTMQRIMGKTVAYHNESALRELVVYDWGNMDTSTGGGYAYCIAHESFDAPLRIIRGYGAPAGQTPDGHAMWKTNITGLYFAVEVYALYTANSTLSTQLPFWMDSNYVDLHFTPTTSGNLKANCDSTIVNTYALVGGIGLSTRIHLYADNTFRPDSDTPITDVDFTKPDGFDLRFENSTTVAGASHKIDFNFDTTGFNAVWPSCLANTVSGNNVNGSTLNFGAYSRKEIMDGLGAVPFQINLTNCSYIKNIEVKLASNSIGTDNTLLSNTLTDSSAASGIGVQIEGVQTNLSSQMVLIPGNANSVYKYSPYASQDKYIDSANEYPANTLNFLATLKQDSNKTITAGEFKATGTFQITYP
ncbi:TPA: fimbrial protein [Salmonella enterica]|nr:fimbrial protein [Salmonella enterica]